MSIELDDNWANALKSSKWREDKPGIIIDYDKDGNVVGMEILTQAHG